MTVTGLLPEGRHRATLDDLETRFVTEAPWPTERATLMVALRLWAMQVWARYPTATLWVNGGFVTHKQWSAPADIDVVCMIPRRDLREDPRNYPELWTLQGVSVAEPRLDGIERIQPVAGLIDGFFAPDLPALCKRWDTQWTSVTDENKDKIPGLRKGYVEVVKP